MKIFPAIDMLDNRAVRLLYGKREEVTDYGSPLGRAELWQASGAEYLHVVDLNGAFDNSDVNAKTLKELVKNVTIPVQLGGGIKSLDKVKYYLEEVGVSRVIIGSSLVTDRGMAEKAFALFGERIACGIDSKDGKVCIKGWVEKSTISPIDLALSMRELGGKVVIYTDITRDGALCGVNVDATVELQDKTGMDIIASGGMSEMRDVEILAEKKLYGAILGRSIYENTIDLAMAIRRAKNVD